MFLGLSTMKLFPEFSDIVDSVVPSVIPSLSKELSNSVSPLKIRLYI